MYSTGKTSRVMIPALLITSGIILTGVAMVIGLGLSGIFFGI